MNFFLSFSYGDQTGLHEGENEGEPGNQIEQKYCRKEESLTPYNEPQIGAQTQIETHSETNVKSEESIKTDDTNSEQCSKESQRHGNVDKSQKEQVMDNGDQTVLREGGNEGEAGNQIEGNNPSKNVNYEKRDSRKEVSMTPDSEPKIGPQTPEKIQADMDKHSESTANTYGIISGDISKELQVLKNVEISKKGQTKDIIKISRNKFDKEFEVSDNPVSIGKRDTESLLPVVAGGKQRLSRQPYGFFFQKEPLTCQPQIKGTKKEKDFKKALIEEKKNEQKSDVSRKGVSAPKQQNEKKFKVNYASKQCGATIEEKNPEAENVDHIITSNKDEYLKNPCAANKKWFVIKLCETIYVKQIETGSFEFYSSQPRDISVDVSDRYPAKEYHSLGVFQLTEGRKLHRFEIKKGDNYPVKYVRVEMLTHYGEEHFCPLTCFKVYGKPVELDAYDKDQEGKYSRDNIEESNPLNAGAKKDTVVNYASSSQKIEPSEPTAEKTNTGFNLLVIIALVFFSVSAVVVLFKSASKSEDTYKSNDRGKKGHSVETSTQRPGSLNGTLVSKSKDICTPNGHGQNTATKGISAHESKQAEYDLTSGEKCVPHNTQPNVTDSESNNQSVNQAGNTSLLYDRNHNGNMAVSDKEQYSNFSLNQDIEEDAVPDAPDALNYEHDVLVMYADKDKNYATSLHKLLQLHPNTKNLNVVLFDYFAPEVQNIFKIPELIFKRCAYLFLLVTSNLKNDSVKRYQGHIALIDSIKNNYERVIPIWAEKGAKQFLSEVGPLSGISYIEGQLDFQRIELLFKKKSIMTKRFNFGVN